MILNVKDSGRELFALGRSVPLIAPSSRMIFSPVCGAAFLSFRQRGEFEGAALFALNETPEPRNRAGHGQVPGFADCFGTICDFNAAHVQSPGLSRRHQRRSLPSLSTLPLQLIVTAWHTAGNKCGLENTAAKSSQVTSISSKSSHPGKPLMNPKARRAILNTPEKATGYQPFEPPRPDAGHR